MPQEIHDACAPELVERAEDLVQDEQRERLPGALGDHLRDREAQHEVGEILLAAGDHRLGDAVLEHDDVVLIVELDLGVAAVGELAQERARQLRELGTQLEVEVGAQVGVRAVELVVQPLVRVELAECTLPVRQLLRRRLRRRERLFGALHLALGRHERQLGASQLFRRAVVALAELRELGFRDLTRLAPRLELHQPLDDAA